MDLLAVILDLNPENLSLFEEDIQKFRTQVEKNPDSISAYMDFGKALYSKQKFEEAIVAFEITVQKIICQAKAYCDLQFKGNCDWKCKQKRSKTEEKADKKLVLEEADAYNNIGLAFQGLNAQEEAINFFRKAIYYYPNHNEANLHLSIALYKKGDLEGAKQALDAVSCPRPEHALICFNHAALLGNSEKVSKIIKLCNINIVSKCNEVCSYLTLMISLCHQGKLAEAIKILEKAIKSTHQNINVYAPYLEILADIKLLNPYEIFPENIKIYYDFGLVLENQDLGAAVRAFKKVIEINPRFQKVYLRLGLILKKKKETAIAESALHAAVKLHDKCPEAYLALSEIMVEQNKLNEAIEVLKTGIKIDPRDKELHYEMSIVLEKKKSYEEAEKSFNMVIELDPSFVRAYKHLGQVLYLQAKLNDALIACVTAVQLDPTDAEAYNNLGLVLHKQGIYSEAVVAYKTAIELNPSFAKAYNNLGLSLFYQGELREALDIYNKAIRLDPQQIVSYCSRGCIFNHLGVQDQASADFLRAYELMQNDKLVVDLSESTQLYVKETLANEGAILVKKLAHLQKKAIETELLVERLHLNDSEPPAGIEKFEFLKKSIVAVTDKVVGKIRNKDEESEIKEDDVIQLKKEIKELKEMNREFQKILRTQTELLSKVDDTLKIAGVYEKAKIKEGFMTLAVENPELFKYCKVFYWTLLNYFTAHRILSTNLVNGNLDVAEPMVQKMLEKGGVKMLKFAKSFSRGVPIVGSVFGVIYGIVVYAVEVKQEHNLFRKVEAVSKILEFNESAGIALEEDISLLCAKTAINITQAKKNKILEKRSETTIQRKASFKKLMDKVKDKVKKLQDLVLPSVNVWDSLTAELALEDVVFLISYMYANEKLILSCKKNLDEQFTEIVLGETLTGD